LIFLGAVFLPDAMVLKLTELDGIKLAKLEAAKRVDLELKLHGIRIKIISLLCLIKHY
jgi:hypothetical protein